MERFFCVWGVPVERPAPLAERCAFVLGQAGLHTTPYRAKHFLAFEFLPCLLSYLPFVFSAPPFLRG